MQLSTQTRWHDGDAVMSVRGELDYSTACELELDLAEVTAQAGRGTVVLDLHDLVFCDSSGLRVFVAAHKNALRAGGRFALADLPDKLRDTLTRTGLTAVLTVHTTASEAVAGNR